MIAMTSNSDQSKLNESVDSVPNSIAEIFPSKQTGFQFPVYNL